MITASALHPACAYVKILSNKKPRTSEQQGKIDAGTRFHKLVETWVRDGILPVTDNLEEQGWIDLFASMWSPPRNTLTEQAWGLWDSGDYAEVEEPLPHVYQATHPSNGRTLLTAGRADLAWLTRDVLYVVDLKTGKWPVACAAENLQVNAAGLALAQLSFARGYVPAVYYARDGHWDFGDCVAVGSPAWEQQWEAVRFAASLPPEPRPGDHCSSCWERRACPAAR